MQTYWTVAIIVSLGVHTCVFALGLPGVFPAIAQPKASKEVIATVKEVKIIPQKPAVSTTPRGAYRGEVTGKKQAYMPSYVENLQNKLIMKNDTRVELGKAPIASKHTSAIVISAFNSEDIAFLKNNPGYMSYYNAISGRLSRIGRKFYTVKESGEVRLVFLISKKGEVLHAEATSESPALRDLALKIIHDASPFPAVPLEFQRDTVPFSISMQFSDSVQ